MEDEFDAFLDCGILARGFLRLRCGECSHGKLVAFRCKRVVDTDMQHCPICAAVTLKIIAAILERPVVERSLTHLGPVVGLWRLFETPVRLQDRPVVAHRHRSLHWASTERRPRQAGPQ
jgi:Transposase zinc-binding domain